VSHNPHHKIRGVHVDELGALQPHERTATARGLRPTHGTKRPNKAELDHRCAQPLHPAHAAALAAPLPASADNSLQPVTDQGQSSACTWHSLVKGIQICTGFYGSMHVGYSCTGELEGETPLADDGRQCTDSLTVAATIGVCPFEGDSPDGRNSDIYTAADTTAKPANVCLPATAAEKALAAERRFDFGGNSISPTDADVSNLVAGCLAAKGVVYLGTQVGAAFEQLAGETVAVPDPANDTSGGGHALIIVGYRTASDGSRQFRVQNSWGESWDENGECWASLAWVQACWELHPLLPISPPASIFDRAKAELDVLASEAAQVLA
jgi:hypothetical protein